MEPRPLQSTQHVLERVFYQNVLDHVLSNTEVLEHVLLYSRSRSRSSLFI